MESNTVNFNGKNESIEIKALPDFLSNQALNYDSLEVVVEERGLSTILNADSKNVKVKQVDNKSEDKDNNQSRTSHILKRNYFVKIGEADDLLKEIGILTKEGKIKNDMIRKYNQIDHFVELIDSMIDELGDVDTINILDCGCGKSYLTFVLNYYIKEKKKKNCFFIGIDRSDKVISASENIAKNLGYKNMKFVVGDINNYEPDRRIDIVISLHACDIATDMALGLAVRTKAKAIMCVPCCHKELLEQYRFDTMQPIIKHGIFKARFADTLTDGVRALLLETQGYKVSVVEYISPLETPKNLLIRQLRLGKRAKSQ
ncbi:SAM-dependent methyltransferase [Fervidicella metallireducens]|uniref:class I SAM-dependent methyltransferase n=1 Tax=Fervidicella metallireducens TaxID=655338 RepID=UPI000AA1613B